MFLYQWTDLAGLLSRLPTAISFLWTIPGTVLVGQALGHLSFAQVIGTYYATGLLMLILGLSGWMRKCMDRLPMPIVMARVAGVFLQFGLNLIYAIRDGFTIAVPVTAVFVAAGVLVALLALLFGIFSPLFTRVMLATPKAFIATLAGLALVRILERAFIVSFKGGFTLGATVIFLVTVANVSILSIGVFFWGLVIGFAVSWVLEKSDFELIAAR